MLGLLTVATTVGVVLVPTAAQAADTSPPSQPGVITVSSITASAASLKWGGSSDNVGIEGYRVYRSISSSPQSLIATTDAVTSYTAMHLYSGKTYTFGVVAIDAANNASQIRTVSVTTLVSSDTTAPAAPSSTSVSFRPFSDSRIDVVWGTSTSSDVAGYRVLRNGVVVGTVDLPNTPRFSDNGLAALTSYAYAITAVDSAGNVSAASTAKTAKTLATGTVLIARGPYLSNVTATTALISWWTNIATAGTVTINNQSFPDGSGQHHAVLVTGLPTGSNLPYSVTSGSATSGGTLHTATAPGSTFSFAAIGDFGGGATGETQNANNIANAGTQFIQTVGDNVYPSSGLPDPSFSTTYSDFDQRLFKPFATALKSQAFLPANGNKEYYGDNEFWAAFPMPGSNHSWYSYDWGDAHILVLDSEQPFASGSDQYNFAQSDLAAHQSAIWRIVAIQRPPYSSTSANSSSKPVQQSLVPLFEAQHVNLVLSGNSHNYERTVPLKGGTPASGGITYVVSGAGGNGFNVFQSSTPPSYTAFRESSYYQYAKVTVSPTQLKVDAIRADTGAVFDTTAIAAGGGTPDTTAPTVPTQVVAQATSPTPVNLTWQASTDAVGVTGYNVYRNGSTTSLTTVRNGTSYSDNTVTGGTNYSYAVTAVDAAGNESARSTSATVTTPTAGGTTVTVAPTGDATISKASATSTTNYGTATTLTVDADGSMNDFLLNFAVPAGCSPTAANLLLTVGSGSTANSVHGGDFYAAPTPSWAEGTVTAASASSTSGLPVSLSAVAINTQYSIDVTSLLQPGSSNLSIRATTSSNDAAAYVSKEAANASTARPSLQITCG